MFAVQAAVAPVVDPGAVNAKVVAPIAVSEQLPAQKSLVLIMVVFPHVSLLIHGSGADLMATAAVATV